MARDGDSEDSGRKPASLLEAQTRRRERRRRSRHSRESIASPLDPDSVDIPAVEGGSTKLWSNDDLPKIPMAATVAREETFDGHLEDPLTEPPEDEPEAPEDATLQMGVDQLVKPMPLPVLDPPKRESVDLMPPEPASLDSDPPTEPPDGPTAPQPPADPVVSEPPASAPSPLEGLVFEAQLPPLLGRIPRFKAHDPRTDEWFELRELRGLTEMAPEARPAVEALTDTFDPEGTPPPWCAVAGVMPLVGVVRDPERGPMAILPYYGAETLASSGVADAKRLGELAAIVGELHRANIVHGHLSAELVVVDDQGQLWLDMLTATLLPTSRARRSGVVSPEVRAGNEPTPAADVFVLSVILAEALGGGVVEGKVSGVPARGLRGLLERGLAEEPPSRATAADITRGLYEHASGGGGGSKKMLFMGVAALALAAVVGVAAVIGVGGGKGEVEPEPVETLCQHDARVAAAEDAGDLLCQAYWLQACRDAAAAVNGTYTQRLSKITSNPDYARALRKGVKRIRKKDVTGEARLRLIKLLYALNPDDPVVSFAHDKEKNSLPSDPCP